MKKKVNENKKTKLSRKDFLKFTLVSAAASVIIPFIGCPTPGSGGGGGGGSGGGGGGTAPATDGTLNFTINFNEPMDTSSVNDSISISPSVTAYDKADLVWSNADQTVSYSKLGFDKSTQYTITVAGTAKDTAGNLLDGNNDGTGGDNYIFLTA